jgi:hypothetical protein
LAKSGDKRYGKRWPIVYSEIMQKFYPRCKRCKRGGYESMIKAALKKDILYLLIKKAQEELRQAEQNFENAEKEYRDVAILELLAKQKKLDALIREAKECA